MKRSLTHGLSWSIGFVPTISLVTLVTLVTLGLASCTPPQRNFGETTGTGGSGGAGGSGGSGGIEMVCVPDTQAPCYSGPDGTLEVGVCKSGTHVCLPDGSAFGECGGDVLPQAENCLTLEDEACNGTNASECPALGNGWFKTFGSLDAAQSVFDVAVTPTGEIVAVGGFADTIDFGIGPMASTGSADIFVAKFDALGNAIWSKRFGDASSQIAYAVAIDNSGAIYVGGSMIGSVDFGNGITKTSAGVEDAFLARFDPDGNIVWAQNFGDAARQIIWDIEISKTNLVVVAGEFAGTINLNPNNPNNTLSTAGSNDVFVARFDGSGFHSASRAFGGPLTEAVRGLALDSQDRVYITGGFDDKVNFGPDLLTSTGGRDAYVAAFSPTLIPQWARGYGSSVQGTTTQEGYDLVVTNTDELVVSGGFVEAVNIDGFKFFAAEPTSRGLFLARLDSAGTVSGVSSYGGIGGNVLDVRLAFDTNAKHLVMVGRVTGGINFGGEPFEVLDSSDPFLVKLGTDFAHISSRLLQNDPTLPDDSNSLLALDLLPTGDLIVGGNMRSPILLDKQPVGPADGKFGDAILARFIP